MNSKSNCKILSITELTRWWKAVDSNVVVRIVELKKIWCQ